MTTVGQGISFVRYVEATRGLSLLGRSFDHHDVVDVSIVANGNKALLIAADRAGTLHLVRSHIPWLTYLSLVTPPFDQCAFYNLTNPFPSLFFSWQCEYNKQHPLSWGGDRLVPAGALHAGGPFPALGGVTRMQSVALVTPDGAPREALVVAHASGR